MITKREIRVNPPLCLQAGYGVWCFNARLLADTTSAVTLERKSLKVTSLAGTRFPALRNSSPSDIKSTLLANKWCLPRRHCSYRYDQSLKPPPADTTDIITKRIRNSKLPNISAGRPQGAPGLLETIKNCNKNISGAEGTRARPTNVFLEGFAIWGKSEKVR